MRKSWRKFQNHFVIDQSRILSGMQSESKMELKAKERAEVKAENETETLTEKEV
jgi:hypothetical protein